VNLHVGTRLARLVVGATALVASGAAVAACGASAGDLLAHYQAEPKEASQLLAVGETKPDATIDPATLAAYTMVANEMMNLDEVLNK